MYIYQHMFGKLNEPALIKAFQVFWDVQEWLIFGACLTEKVSAERIKVVMEHIWRMQEFCNSMSKLSPDAYEYAYLKTVVLFSPGEARNMRECVWWWW